MIVYTTVFGKTDPLHEPRCKSGWRFVCFTDQNITARRWEVVRVPTLERPARECRRLKLLPHLTFPQASISLWIDCCFTLLVSPEVIAERLATCRQASGLPPEQAADGHCGAYRPSDGRCSGCGCWVEDKAEDRTAVCPLGRWRR